MQKPSPTAQTEFQFYEKVPNEIWIAIFDRVTTPRDLLHLITACKHFYSIGWSSLHRTIFLASTTLDALWGTKTTLEALPPDSPLPATIQGMVIGGFLRHRCLSALSAGEPHASIGPIIEKFYTHITSLVFIGVSLPSTFLQALTSLHKLQRLHFYSSSIEARSPTDPQQRTGDLAILRQLKDLRLWRNEGYQPTSPQTLLNTHFYSPPRLRIPVALLHMCKNIHTLHIDWEAMVPTILCRNLQDHFVALRYLCIRMPPLEVQKESTRFSSSLFPRVLSCFHQLEELRILGNVHIASDGHLSWNGTIPPIRGYTGPRNLVTTFDVMPPLESVTFTWAPSATSHPTVALLNDLFSRMTSETLQELNICVGFWDMELIYCITFCFPKLKVLRIAYTGGRIDNERMPSFAAEHLARLPNLEIFHLFYLNIPRHPYWGSSSGGQDAQRRTLEKFHQYLRGTLSRPVPPKLQVRWSMSDEETKEVLAAWNKYAPRLREVRFTVNSLWRRLMQGDGKWGVWKMYDELSVEVDMLVYSDNLEAWKEFESLR
ncbi:hypothetical protein VNI00_009172 [Paramarasmius palmivorus]|uniref:F-box domain-containing protein n=1 Tax=Paramarasmius palmivorus TaxID=297713 RepID=A0AAW0CR64_9AGAR